MKYLGFVMVGNHDGHGNFVERMQNSVNSIFNGIHKWNVEAELLFIEWGTPESNQKLRHAVDWSKSQGVTRFIDVPKAFIKANVPNPNGLKFEEPFAKCHGIRRSDGKFILVVNVDSIWPDAIFEFFAKKELRHDSFYRVDRIDIDQDNRILRINRANGSFGEHEPWIGISKTDAPYSKNMLHFNSSGEFLLAHRQHWFNINGYVNVNGVYWGSTDGQTLWLLHQEGLKQVILPWPLLHQDHPRGDSWMPEWRDAKPFGIKNGDNWGFPNEIFNEEQL